MSKPTQFNRQSSFANYQSANPSRPLPGNLVDAEFNAAKVTLDEILTNLALIQRDDGALANGSVGLDQLSAEIEVGWQAPEVWVTGTAYVSGDTVFHSSAFYRLLTAHTAGVFATDLAASKWELIVDLSGLAIVAASQIANTPAGSIAATTVQAAINELASEKAATSHTHPSSAITDSTAAGRAVLTAADSAAQRTALGLGALAVEDTVPVTDIDAQIALTGDISPSALAANTNDWSPTGLATASTIKFSASSAINVTGLLAASDGDIKVLHNIGSFPITLTANDTSSATANRFVFAGSVRLAPNTDIALQYDNTSATKGWRKLTATVTAPRFDALLTKSGANLLLSRCNGMHLFINGANEIIPAAGVTLAPTGLTVGALYYIYAYMPDGVMTLTANIVGPSVSANYGHKLLTEGAPHTLVGMARLITGPAWVDTAAQRFVRSYYNDPGTYGKSAFTTDRTATSTSYSEINSEIRCEFLSWTGEVVQVIATGKAAADNAQSWGASIGIDDTTAEETFSGGTAATGNLQSPLSVSVSTTLTEGYHYATLLGLVSGGTGTWSGSAAAGTRCALNVRLRR